MLLASNASDNLHELIKNQPTDPVLLKVGVVITALIKAKRLALRMRLGEGTRCSLRIISVCDSDFLHGRSLGTVINDQSILPESGPGHSECL
jgi:hypothetical protein